MFICNDCAIKSGVNSYTMLIAPQSKGPCEMCKKTDICMDIHHSLFPIKKEKKGKKKDA